MPAGDYSLNLSGASGSITTGGANNYMVSACNVGHVYDACLHWQPSGSITYNYITSSLPNKFEQSFKIAAMLMEQGLIEECSISKFCELIKKIQAEL